MDKYFSIEKQKDIFIVTLLFSELSMEEADHFKEELYNLITDSDKKFLVDMHKCNFFPSLALSIIINFNAKVNEKGGKAIFCCLTEPVKSIFKITKLNQILTIQDSQEHAIKSIG